MDAKFRIQEMRKKITIDKEIVSRKMHVKKDLKTATS